MKLDITEMTYGKYIILPKGILTVKFIDSSVANFADFDDGVSDIIYITYDNDHTRKQIYLWKLGESLPVFLRMLQTTRGDRNGLENGVFLISNGILTMFKIAGIDLATDSTSGLLDHLREIAKTNFLSAETTHDLFADENSEAGREGNAA